MKFAGKSLSWLTVIAFAAAPFAHTSLAQSGSGTIGFQSGSESSPPNAGSGSGNSPDDPEGTTTNGSDPQQTKSYASTMLFRHAVMIGAESPLSFRILR